MANKIRLARLLAVLLFSVASASSASAADINITWGLGVTQPPVSATVGDNLIFNYAGGHNVEEFPDPTAFGACDFSSATFLNGAGPLTIPLTSAGTFYYGCSVGSHCASGSMSVEVLVSAGPAAVPGANPILLGLALLLMGTAAAWRVGSRSGTRASS